MPAFGDGQGAVLSLDDGGKLLALHAGAICDTPDRRVVQPVQDYFLIFEEKQSPEGADINPFRYYTHVGSDYGPMPDARQVSWRPMNGGPVGRPMRRMSSARCASSSGACRCCLRSGKKPRLPYTN